MKENFYFTYTGVVTELKFKSRFDIFTNCELKRTLGENMPGTQFNRIEIDYTGCQIVFYRNGYILNIFPLSRKNFEKFVSNIRDIVPIGMEDYI